MPEDPTTGEVLQRSELVAAVCEVLKEVSYIQKTGYNSQQRYAYASDADLLAPLQASMARHGLMLCPVGVDINEREWKSPKGAAGLLTSVKVTYSLRHVSGEVVLVQAPGAAWNNMDKGVYSAMTGALKYAHRQSFQLPTGDDAERDQPELERKPAPPVDPESRDKLRRAWHARLGALADANLTPKLDVTERHLVQQSCWGVESLGDLDDADCAHHLQMLRDTDDGGLAAHIRKTIGADQ